MRSVAIAGWLGIFALACLWEGIGLVRGADWPTISDMLRSSMSTLAGRVILLAIWMWLGWHLFLRHWEFFMRAP